MHLISNIFGEGEFLLFILPQGRASAWSSQTRLINAIPTTVTTRDVTGTTARSQLRSFDATLEDDKPLPAPGPEQCLTVRVNTRLGFGIITSAGRVGPQLVGRASFHTLTTDVIVVMV